jgi:hypothetical protein
MLDIAALSELETQTFQMRFEIAFMFILQGGHTLTTLPQVHYKTYQRFELSKVQTQASPKSFFFLKHIFTLNISLSSTSSLHIT